MMFCLCVIKTKKKNTTQSEAILVAGWDIEATQVQANHLLASCRRVEKKVPL
jgi:hypothetical protein